jgi:resuscitation-promoting factor RpfB
MRRPVFLAPLGALLVLGAAGVLATTSLSESPPAESVQPLAASMLRVGTVMETQEMLAAAHSIDRIQPDLVATAVAIPHETEWVEDDTLPIGQMALRVAGLDGTRLEVRPATSYDDEVIETGPVVEERIVAEPVTEVVAFGTKDPEPPPGVWDRLAQCESNGNWAINTGNGYYGGLQFSASTWRAYGGTGLPHEHSRAEQIRVAEVLRAAEGGYGAWPTCSRRLGLPR